MLSKPGSTADMREAGIGARPRRPFRPKTTQPDHTATVSPNLLRQTDSPTRPGEQMVSDITYIPTREGWLYLVVIIDLFSRAIIGWDLADSLAAEGLIRAAQQAHRSGLVHPAAIFHSDRGCPIHQPSLPRVYAESILAAEHERQRILL